MQSIRQLHPWFIMKQIPVGRFGNHLFQWNLINQLAMEFEIPYSHPKFIGSNFSKGLRRHNYIRGLVRYPSYRLIELKNKNVYWCEIEELIRSKIRDGVSIEIPSGVMGSRFFDSNYRNPSGIGDLSTLIRRQDNQSEPYIAMHFRGTDFREWNELADIPSGYYSDALDTLKALRTLKGDLKVRLVTDDPDHVTVAQIRKSTGAIVERRDSQFEDFSILANADALISSPSTFAIWAAIMGKPKSVAFPKAWVNSRIEIEDPFWIGISGNRGKLFDSVVMV